MCLLQTSKKGHRLPVPQKKFRQRVECSSKKRFLIVYDHFDSYTMKASSSKINDNTGIMSPIRYNSNNSNATIVTRDVSANNNVSLATDELPVITTAVLTSSAKTLPTWATTDGSSKEVTDSSFDTCSSDCSDSETLTQADRRDLGPGTRTDMSPLMNMEFSKQRLSLHRSSPCFKEPPSKRLCQFRGQPPGRCE